MEDAASEQWQGFPASRGNAADNDNGDDQVEDPENQNDQGDAEFEANNERDVNQDEFALDYVPYQQDQAIVSKQADTSTKYADSLEEELAALEQEQLAIEGGKKAIDSNRYKRMGDADSVYSSQSKRTRRVSSPSEPIVESLDDIYGGDMPLASNRRFTVKYEPMDTNGAIASAATAEEDQQQTDDTELEQEYEQLFRKTARPTLQMSPSPQSKRIRKDATQQPTGDF